MELLLGNSSFYPESMLHHNIGLYFTPHYMQLGMIVDATNG